MSKSRWRSPRWRTDVPQSLREFLIGPPAVGQRELAAAAKCHQSTISMLLRGKRRPSTGLAVRLHSITKVPLASLVQMGLRKPRSKKKPSDDGSSTP